MIRALSSSSVAQVVNHRLNARFLLSYSFDRISGWLTTIAVLILAYQLTESIGYAAAFVLVQLLGRSLVLFLLGSAGRIPASLVVLAAILRVGTIAGLILFESRSDIWWAMALVAAYGATCGLVEAAQSRLLPILGPRRQVPILNRATGRCEQVSAVVGPALAAVILLVGDFQAAFAVAAFLSYLALVFLRGILTENSRLEADDALIARHENPFDDTGWRIPSDVRTVITALVAMAALGVVVRLTLLDVIIDRQGQADAVYAVLIALVGIGALAGPMPVDRVLGHFPVSLVLAGGVGSVAFATVVMGLGGPLFLIVPALLAIGLVIVTIDITAAVSIRRSVPGQLTGYVNNAIVNLIFAGQVVALLVVLAIGSTWSVTLAAIVVSVMSALAIGVHFLQSGGYRLSGSSGRGDADKTAPS